jgi:copper chaperone
MREEQIPVPEIHCDHCKMSIEGAVQAVPGVESVKVDVPGKQVTVAYNEATVGLDRIKAAIKEQGYEVPA